MVNSGDWDPAVVDSIINDLQHQPGALLPILQAVQQALGYIPARALPTIANRLNLSRAEVHGVVSFYHTLRDAPAGRHTLQICRAESCQAMGSRALEAYAKQLLNIDYHQTTADGEISLEPVYCLGNCACSPAVRVGDRIYGNVDRQQLDELVSTLTSQVVEVQ